MYPSIRLRLTRSAAKLFLRLQTSSRLRKSFTLITNVSDVSIPRSTTFKTSFSGNIVQKVILSRWLANIQSSEAGALTVPYAFKVRRRVLAFL